MSITIRKSEANEIECKICNYSSKIVVFSDKYRIFMMINFTTYQGEFSKTMHTDALEKFMQDPSVEIKFHKVMSHYVLMLIHPYGIKIEVKLYDVLKEKIQNNFGGLVCTKLAAIGEIHILEWARSIGCPWDAATCAAAAKNGHLNVLMWLRKNGCPWDSTTCTNAAKYGNLELLKWVYKHSCERDIDVFHSIARDEREYIPEHVEWIQNKLTQNVSDSESDTF
jgi:hypothetical protein